MDPYHTPTRGWLSRRMKGRQWLLLGLFMLFYVGMMTGPGAALLQEYRLQCKADVAPTENVTHVEQADSSSEELK